MRFCNILCVIFFKFFNYVLQSTRAVRVCMLAIMDNRKPFITLGSLGSAAATLGNGWQSFCCLLGSLCLSFTLPLWLLNKLWMLHQRRQCTKKLQDKVLYSLTNTYLIFNNCFCMIIIQYSVPNI